MKKIIYILITIVFLISMAACSKEETVDLKTDNEIVEEEIIEEEVIEEDLVEEEIIEEELVEETKSLLTLDNEKILADFKVNEEATIFEFDEITIDIPKDAYNSEISFNIKRKDIIENELEVIEPVSAFYEIDNGDVFSNVAIGLQIPLTVDTEEFVMAFYFDEKEETLEGIPSIRLSNGDLLVKTHHFSNIFVGMMNEIDLEKYKSGGAIVTNFKPGVDDFSFVNHGSFIAPGGHCSGQSIAALWYFKNIRRFKLDDPSSALYTLLDNNGLFPTPKFWKDDSLLYRFASSVHEDEDKKNFNFAETYISNVVFDYDYTDGYKAKDHWNACYTSMIVTNRPQFVGIYRDGKDKKFAGHAMIAYKVEGNKLYVADPNFPGQIRYIEYANGEFKPYSSGSTSYNKIYYLGEFSTIDEWKVEKRWNEVVNKDLSNEYFPFPMIITDGVTSYKKSFEFNIDIIESELKDIVKFYVYDNNLNGVTFFTNKVLEAYDLSRSAPLLPENEIEEKYEVSLNDEGDNWIGFYHVDENDNWINFQWIKIFVDTKLELIADKYTINPGDTSHIEAKMSTGIDFPDLSWGINDESDSSLKSKTYDFTSEEVGEYVITASDSSGNLFELIEIVVTDKVIEEHDPISEEDSNFVEGTYSCSFWLNEYEAIPFENFESGVFYSAEQKKQVAIDNANYYNELYNKKLGEITKDKDNFSITLNDDGTCNVVFSSFLYVNSNSKGVENIPFNGGNINWTAKENGSEFSGNVQFKITDESIKMTGSISKKSPENQLTINESKTYYFEGEKID